MMDFAKSPQSWALPQTRLVKGSPQVVVQAGEAEPVGFDSLQLNSWASEAASRPIAMGLSATACLWAPVCPHGRCMSDTPDYLELLYRSLY